MKLSIILPVFNVEKYIRLCLESIYNQGLEDGLFEVLVVNDGCTDNSLNEISKIISEHSNIFVINEKNQGQSVARNNGIARAKGEYVLMIDPDDLLITKSLPQLLNLACSSSADLIVADFVEMNDSEIAKYDNLPLTESFETKEKTGIQMLLEELNPYECYIWRTLYRRDFLINNGIKFIPEAFSYEDIPFTHECYLKAKKCIRAYRLLNIYRRGHESATNNILYTPTKAKRFCIAISNTWQLAKNDRISQNIQSKIMDNVFVLFSILVSTIIHGMKDSSDREMILEFIKQQIPDMNFKNGFKQRLVSFLIYRFPRTYMAIRYMSGLIIDNHIRPFYYHRLKGILKR